MLVIVLLGSYFDNWQVGLTCHLPIFVSSKGNLFLYWYKTLDKVFSNPKLLGLGFWKSISRVISKFFNLSFPAPPGLAELILVSN